MRAGLDPHSEDGPLFVHEIQTSHESTWLGRLLWIRAGALVVVLAALALSPPGGAAASARGRSGDGGRDRTGGSQRLSS